MKSLKLAFILLICALSCFSQNIMISSQNYPEETTIKLNPKNPAIIVAGANLNNYYYSSDTGRTWNRGQLTSNHGVWGDPVIEVDTTGNFFFFHLSNPPSGNWIDRIVCQKSTNNGKTWSDGTFVGLNGKKAQDKQWSIVDRQTNTIYLTWTQFDSYGSSSPSDSSIILFSKSVDEGMSWETPKRINKIAGDCIDSDNTVEGAVPAVGPLGELYVAWAGPGGIWFDRSSDRGQTWLENDIFVDAMPGGWDYDIPGISRTNGFPITKCDLSNSPYHGTIYINWSDQRNGTDDTDVWLSKSIDGGFTWSTPIRVNDDEMGHQQFFTWMDIDQTTGWLYFVFYDRRNYTDNKTDVYLAISADGGETFLNRKISESPFVPVSGIFFGDYTNISVHNNIIRPIWTRLHNGQLSIWTDITPLENLLASTQNTYPTKENGTVEGYPNPSKGIFYVSFKLHAPALVSLDIYDQNGRLAHSIFSQCQFDYGKHIIPIDTKKIGLKPGSYICSLKSKEWKEKQIVMIVL